MNFAYFYDSDLSGQPNHNISSSVLVEGDINNIEKFAVFWKGKIDDANLDEKQINDTFVNLLIDLSLCIKDKNNFKIKLLVLNNIFFDFISFIALFSTGDFNLVRKVDIYQEFSDWQEKGYSELMDKISSVEELEQFSFSYALNHEKNNIIKETLENHKYSLSDLQLLKSTDFPQISKYVKIRIPFYHRMFKLLHTKKIFLPFGHGIDDFCSLFEMVESEEKPNKIAFDSLPQENAIFRVLSFVSNKINEYMFEFLTKELDSIDISHKHAIILIWGLWLGTAFNYSMIPQNWILKYKVLLKDVFDKDIFTESNQNIDV